MLRPVTDYSFPFIAVGLADVVAAGGYGAIGAHGQQQRPRGALRDLDAGFGDAARSKRARSREPRTGPNSSGRTRDLGSIEVGKLADFMVLNTIPLTNIRNTTDIRFVVKNGVVYDDERWTSSGRPLGPTGPITGWPRRPEG